MFNCFVVILGVNSEGRCSITPNKTACRYSWLIICGTLNYGIAFSVGACMSSSSSKMMGPWGVWVGVGGVF